MASLEQVLNLNTASFEDIIGRLKAYEERVSEEVEAEEEQGKLMYTNAEGQGSQSNRSYNRGATDYNGQQTRDYNREYRGRGRGGRF